MSLEVLNFTEWERAVQVASADLIAATEASLKDLALRIGEREKRAAPNRSRIRAEETITVTEDRPTTDVYVLDVGPEPWEGIRLAHYEFGTSRQAPRPFMRPIIADEWNRWDPSR